MELTKKQRSDRMRKSWEDRPKCPNHPKSVCTKNSIAKGYPLCYFCDPEAQALAAERKSPPKKHRLGSRMAVLPPAIAELYAITSTDNHLIELGEDIAVAEARLLHILKSIRDNPLECTSFITHYTRQYKRNLVQVKKGFMTYKQFSEEMLDLLDKKGSAIMMYEEFDRVTEIKRKLVEAETSRIVKLGWTPRYVSDVMLAMTRIARDILPPDRMSEFSARLAQDQIFSNKSFQLAPKEDIIDTEEIDGEFIPNSDTQGDGSGGGGDQRGAPGTGEDNSDIPGDEGGQTYTHQPHTDYGTDGDNSG